MPLAALQISHRALVLNVAIFNTHGEDLGRSLGRGWMVQLAGVEFEVVSDATLHSLRHSAASWMMAGGDVKAVQMIRGHSVPSTTLNIYSHTTTGHQAAAVAVIDETLTAARKRRTLTAV